MWLSLLSVLANKRQAVWDADLKAVRGGSAVGQTGLLLGDPLFSKELENMGRQLAGRHHFCVVWYVYVCSICACRPLMITTAGGKTRTFARRVWGFRRKNALLSMRGSFPLRLNREKNDKLFRNSTQGSLFSGNGICAAFSEWFIFMTVSNLSDVWMTQRFSLRGNQTKAWSGIPDRLATSAYRRFSSAGWCKLQEVCWCQQRARLCLCVPTKAFISINVTLLPILLA